jgi:hypothetical protein
MPRRAEFERINQNLDERRKFAFFVFTVAFEIAASVLWDDFERSDEVSNLQSTQWSDKIIVEASFGEVEKREGLDDV